LQDLGFYYDDPLHGHLGCDMTSQPRRPQIIYPYLVTRMQDKIIIQTLVNPSKVWQNGNVLK